MIREEQINRNKITEFFRNCCVSAGAGAGKTTCLVRAYLNLLKNGFNPAQIVVITFTEKAANELRMRIISEMESSRFDGKQLHSLEWAPISTIHSFCARLLREHASFCSLDPDFAILDAPQFETFCNQTLKTLLRKLIKERHASMAALLAEYKLPVILELLTELLKASYVNALTPEGIYQATRRAHEEDSAYLAELKHNMDALIEELASQLPAKSAYLPNMQSLIMAWRASASYFSLIKFIGGNWGKNLTPLRHQLIKSISQLAESGLMKRSWEISQHVLWLFGLACQAIEDDLKASSALSFDHLLIEADKLLANEAAASRLREKYPVIMVDEYQDVNPLQARLIAGLAGHDNNGSANKLMVVGDRKQSIYGFRGADVGVFNLIKSRFEASDEGDAIAICNNYRSSPELIAFFNDFFEQQVFAGHNGQLFEVAYDKELDAQLVGREQPATNDQAIEIWDCRDDENKLLDIALSREALVIAEQIEQMLEQGRQPGDIVLLFRRFSKISIYEEALLARNIPFYVEKGRNFYQRAEVVDLALGLASLERPLNPAALLGALLSSIFGLSLDGVLVGLGEKDCNLMDLLQNPGKLPTWLDSRQMHAWQEASNFYSNIAPHAHRMQPSELIKALLESTGWQYYLAASVNGAQKLANLRKLLEASRQPPFIQNPPGALLAQLEQADQEAQAPLLGGQANVVRLMSIHQAKGLEFPVVILPELEGARARKSLRALFLLDRQGVMALRLGIPWLENRQLYSSLFSTLWQEHQARDAAETSRIFYVACTRAQERLVFCQSSLKPESDWAKWVEQLGADGEQVARHNIAVRIMHEPRPPASILKKEEQDEDPGQYYALATQIVANCTEEPVKPSRIITSVSNLEEWLQCPRRGWLRQQWGIDWAQMPYGKGHKRGDDTLQPQKYGFAAGWQLGNIVHKILELTDFAKGSGQLASILSQLNLPPDYQERIIFLLTPLWQTPLPGRIAGHSQVKKEEPFVLYLHHNEFVMEISGEVDLLASSPASAPLIVDYKAGHYAPEKYEPQMACYAYAAHMAANDAPLPQTILCFFNESGCQLYEKQFTRDELLTWQNIFLEAGFSMLHADSMAKLAKAPVCDTSCHLNNWCKGE